MSEFPGLETMHGHLDLGQRIGEEADHLLGIGHNPDAHMPEALEEALAPPMPTVPVKEQQPAKAHYRSFTLDGTEAQEITSPYPNRKTIRVTVESGGPARIGADNRIGAVAGDPLSVAVAVGGFPLTMLHTDRVFAHGPANTVVGVVEEHYGPA